jgi:hypothetical protein
MVTNIFRKRRKYESMKIAILGSLSRFQIYIKGFRETFILQLQ